MSRGRRGPGRSIERRGRGLRWGVLSVRDLSISFRDPSCAERKLGVAHAAMSLAPGRTLAVVGESGSGKSVTALSIMGLLPAGQARVDSGRIELASAGGEAVDLLTLSAGRLRRIRGRRIAMIFQEPMTSLNPLMSVGEQIGEAVTLHQGLRGAAAVEACRAALEGVGIDDPRGRLASFPHELSGGMRQRVMIAIALACNPEYLIADEPTTALDVTVQAQILDLLDGLCRARGLGVLLITHDLGIVRQRADTVCVMYAGRVVEYGPTHEVLRSPMHPYTRALIACVPRLGDRRARLTTLADMGEWELRRAIEGLAPWWPEATGGAPRGGLAPTLRQFGPQRWACVLAGDVRAGDGKPSTTGVGGVGGVGAVGAVG